MDKKALNLKEFLKTNAYGIYDELPVGIALCDSEGSVRDCNAHYLGILGVERKDILGYNIFDSYNFTDEVMEKIRSSESYQYDVLYTVPKDVFVNTSADTISISVKIVRCSEAESTTGYIIYLTNHTNEWKKYEEQLDAQDRRYRDLVDNLPLDYTHTKLIFDENGQIVDYLNMSGNKSCEDFYIAHNMTWGETLASKFLPETGHVIIDKLNEIRNSGATGGHFIYDTTEVNEIYDMVVVFEGGDWVNLLSVPVTGIEREKRYAEEKLNEERQDKQEQLSRALAAAQQASRAKSAFLNNMSHDIRTPMNAIIGFTSLAQAHLDDRAQVQDYLAKISTSSAHLLNLINDILDMSRIESGAVKLEEKAVHIPDVLQDIDTMVQGLVNDKKLTLIVDMQDVVHENVYADKLRLNQVLLNIVGNAIKFTQPGGRIVLRLTEKASRMQHYRNYIFTVQDNGIGMSQEFLGHIFDTFSREHSSTVSGIQGTGLGMAISKNIVDMMGGEITVESEEGKGSLFTVTLSLRLADETEKNASSAKQSMAEVPAENVKDPRDYSGRRVLLVEDNELNREIATAILEETGLTIDSVSDGDMAVSAINGAPADKYDLVLMDIQMPKMDGYTATREIRTLPDNRKANIPIVAMTANAFEEDRQKAFASGMNGHIIKPINIEDITRVLDEIFAEKR